MGITINKYCRINQNGSININTDPLFGIIPSTFSFSFGGNGLIVYDGISITSNGVTISPSTPFSGVYNFSTFGWPIDSTGKTITFIYSYYIDRTAFDPGPSDITMFINGQSQITQSIGVLNNIGQYIGFAPFINPGDSVSIETVVRPPSD